MTINRQKDDIVEVSDTVSFYALLSLIIIFLLVVSTGWSRMFSTVITLPHGWSESFSLVFTFLQYVAGLTVALMGVTLGKAIAAERIRITAEDTPKYKHTWKGYFLLLLVISALGTMNTVFMQTQQGSVLGEVISTTRNYLLQLKFKVDEHLATPAYDQQKTEVEQLFINFERELRNPANCGFGAQANKHFRELQSVLPKLQPMSLGSRACENIGVQISAYKETVEKLVLDLPDPITKRRFQQRQAFISQIDKIIFEIDEMKVRNASLSKAVVLPALTVAWNSYEQILKEVELISGVALELKSEIVDKKVQGMGGMSQIIPLLLSQLDDSRTYFTIGAAVLIDVLLILFFARYIHSRVLIRRSSLYPTQPGNDSGRVKNIFEE